MSGYSKFNMIYRLQRWLDSVPGQTFLNYAYSWGASIVILGTLFKLTHLPGANLMLYLGMGTEVIVFFISAFDRPFDKTAIGKDIPVHVTDEYLEGENIINEQTSENETVNINGVNLTGQPIIIGQPITGTVAPVGSGNGSAVSETPNENAELNINIDSQNWVANQQQINPEMEEATNNYVEELKKLTETLAKVSEQSARLTRDSEEMENLNRTLTGICKVYEMQLKGASSQIGTIDQINEQSRKMASQIEQLNNIYTRMIEAMTVNMRVAANNGNNAEV
ncbi:MAG: gliding motility protein GldL [Prevotella sp.]|nr:gliding motility protein GldL [Paraprevotella sp.]MCI6201512.1 gliding motility protein GldL [Paraprevotella sp.]MDD5855062.1 gliding motility protein GldL [Prevotella sp.]MDD7692631.1 gliding motility protein GldL [Prevotella sp.]MDY4407688.1 gliding motility protein GldL [Prevotella sp.]